MRDHRFWTPWIMLYSGPRPGEIAQLHLADVRRDYGIWIMHITEEGDGDKRTRPKGSMRVVPIHSELIRLRLIEHQKIVTYSFRHTFMALARLAGVMDDEIGLIAGHGKPTMTGRCGPEREGALKRRQEIIEAVRYALESAG